jgi:hypothetical protein
MKQANAIKYRIHKLRFIVKSTVRTYNEPLARVIDACLFAARLRRAKNTHAFGNARE